MKTYYHDRLIDNAEPSLVHDQFGAKYAIPKNGGKTIEFRKFSALPKALTALTEGVTPSGGHLDPGYLTATVAQYGDYITISDMLDLSAIDPILLETISLQGPQAGRTLDTITREVITGGSNKLFAPSVASDGTETAVLLRSSVTTSCNFTPKMAAQAANKLKKMNASPIGDSYVAIVHPDTTYELRRSTEWIDSHKYATPENIYNGEVGKLSGIRFVETTEAKIIAPSAMLGITGYLRDVLYAAVDNSVDIFPTIPFTTTQATAINAAITAGTVYQVYVNGVIATVASVTGGAVGTCKITLSAAVTKDIGAVLCGTGAGKLGAAIYCTMVIGANAYGVTEIQGAGLQHIVKQLGSGDDPLNQRSTAGWKATKVAERLVEENMVRVEHSSAQYGATAESN
jgi:N4-gp56 family major capsid protein